MILCRPGGGVTGPALCDVTLASDRATFSTPFKQLGVLPEGCSSVHFQRIMGEENARRMLEEGWKPKAEEAKEIGLVSEVVPHDQLLTRAQVTTSSHVSNVFTRVQCPHIRPHTCPVSSHVSSVLTRVQCSHPCLPCRSWASSGRGRGGRGASGAGPPWPSTGRSTGRSLQPSRRHSSRRNL